MGGIGGVQKNEGSDVSKVFMHGILNKLNLKLVDLNTKVITLNIYQVSLAWKQKKKKEKKQKKKWNRIIQVLGDFFFKEPEEFPNEQLSFYFKPV